MRTTHGTVRRLLFVYTCLLLSVPAVRAAAPSSTGSGIRAVTHGFRLRAGSLERTLIMENGTLATIHLRVDQAEVLAAPSKEFHVRISYASPNRKPRGLAQGEGGVIEWSAVVGATDTSKVSSNAHMPTDELQWVDAVDFDGAHWATQFSTRNASIIHNKDGAQELILRGESKELSCTLHYFVYPGSPAIRKWISLRNKGDKWIRLDRMRMEDWAFTERFRTITPLTPSERGAVSSVLAAGSADGSHGLILGSEVPSALRDIASDGSMGYADEFFEWVLGPGESFASEPVFTYAYTGERISTISGVSTPLDRTLERPFQEFLKQRLHLLVDAKNVPAPYYSTWTHFAGNITEANVAEMANRASAAGFRMVQLDDGWQRDRLGTEVATTKFPHFGKLAQDIEAKGLRLGLWVSSFRTPGSRALTDVPDAPSRPVIHRTGGEGMSFAYAPWREYFANELAGLAKTYGVTYFKQDFSNVRYGDLAADHESRTLKESYLRGLRGLLATEDLVRRKVPGVTLELTHEIYWGTPGVPCDLAVLEHVQQYHIPPNDYLGAGNRNRRVADQTAPAMDLLREQLLLGTFHARERFFQHRGLPLQAIEYYGATAASFEGSLTPELQDRQVVSWLMGAPMVFSGDLASLSDENIKRYHDRFALLQRLNEHYGIYAHFQFSGVPAAPTDVDWEWWGKLNSQGYGAVVVLRGSKGEEQRTINVPWVQPHRRYRATALFTGRGLGTFSGAALQAGALRLTLPMDGQEIVELSPATAGPTE